MRIVTIGIRKSSRIVTFCSSGRIITWLTFIACGPAELPHLHALPDEVVEHRDVEVAVEQREEADHDVGDRRREVRPQLLLRDREDVTHGRLPLLPASSPWSPALRRLFGRQRQEDLLEAQRIGRSSSRPQPPLTTARARSRRTSRPLLALDFVPDHPVAPIRFGDARDARHALQRARRVGAVRVDLHVHRFRPAQPRGQVVAACRRRRRVPC